MAKIHLINMPFADIRVPPIAITQLQSIINEQFAGSVPVHLHHFNHELATYLELPVYFFIAKSEASNNSGFGDWFFRQEAFPELKDNTDEFFVRYGELFGKKNIEFYHREVSHKRKQMGAFLDKLIVDNNLDEAQIVGFTSTFMQNVASFALAKKIKERNPNVVIVMGGANCESPMGEEIIGNVPYIDYVFSGPALKSFPAFIRNYLDDALDKTRHINGVFFRENKTSSPAYPVDDRLNPNRDVTTKASVLGDELNINERIDLNYDSFLNSFDAKFRTPEYTPYILFETSRGCWWGAKAHCTFCGLNGGTMSYRAMRTDVAIEFFQRLFDLYAKRADFFSSVDNIIPTEYIKDVFPKLKVPENVLMFYEVKADLSSEDLKVLAAARIREIQPGIESLSTATLKLMKKGTTAFNNIKFLLNAGSYGINPLWNLLIGFPGEEEVTYEKYSRDIPLLFHLIPPMGVFPVRFDRYSPYFTRAKEYNLDLYPLDYYNLTYPFEQKSLNNLAYYFGDRNYTASYIQSTSLWISPLTALVNKWQERYYNTDNKIKAELYEYRLGDDVFIYDSRSGVKDTYLITGIAKAILNNLTIRKNHAGLAQELKASVSQSELEAGLEFLMSKGLIFEENGSMMSLLPESEPSLSQARETMKTSVF